MADDRRRKGGGEDATTVEPETLPKKEREGIVQWDDNGELTIVLDCGRYCVEPPDLLQPSSGEGATIIPFPLHPKFWSRTRH